jgi:hypothetical protein
MKWGCDRRESLAAAGMESVYDNAWPVSNRRGDGRRDGGEREQDAGAA